MFSGAIVDEIDGQPALDHLVKFAAESTGTSKDAGTRLYITLANFLPDPTKCAGALGTFTNRDLFTEGGPLPTKKTMTYKLRYAS
jgi:hypothetical protein